jgi:hypothetical protein
MWLSGNHGLAEEDLKIWCVRKLPEGWVLQELVPSLWCWEKLHVQYRAASEYAAVSALSLHPPSLLLQLQIGQHPWMSFFLLIHRCSHSDRNVSLFCIRAEHSCLKTSPEILVR